MRHEKSKDRMESAGLETNGHTAHVLAPDNANGSPANGSAPLTQPDSPRNEEPSEASRAAEVPPRVRKRTKTGCLSKSTLREARDQNLRD